MLILHIAAFIVAEKREGGALVSAMFTGNQYLQLQREDASEDCWLNSPGSPLRVHR
jgi:hypothetical protein